MAITLLSPSKTNLFLKIERKRADHFHELSTLMLALSLCDKLTIKEADSDSFFCTDPTLPTNNDNLVIKARDLFRAATNDTRKVSIRLKKQIPHGAGLGGGSSNAATTLFALNQLAKSPLNVEELMNLGAVIGSDIPFFFSKGYAYCKGRGEIVLSLEEDPFEQKIWVVKPNYGLSTPKVYKALEINTLKNRSAKDELEAWKKGKGIYFNDLEQSAFSILPELLDLKRKLKQIGLENILLSGSGTSFIASGDLDHTELPFCSIYQVSPMTRCSNKWYTHRELETLYSNV